MNRLRIALTIAWLAPVVVMNACAEDTAVIPETPDGATPSIGTDAARDDAQGASNGGSADAQADAPDTGTDSCPIGQDDTVVATIKATADDYLRLWVNGKLVDDKTTTWGTVDTHNVNLFRHPSRKNVLAVEVRNAFNAGGYDRGLLVDLGFDAGPDAGPDGGVPGIVTDPTWKIIGTLTDGGLPDGGLSDGGSSGIVGWFDPAYDDSSWHAAVDEGPHGMSPWGSVFGTSNARWLWSYNSSLAGSKPAEEFVYFRRAFYLDVDGVPRDAPQTCR